MVTGVGAWHVGAGTAALTIGVGAVVTVFTAGTATPVWILISAGALGGGAAVCGASEVYEGTQTIVYAWDSTAAAPVNPVRDYVFDDLLHDRDDYYLFMAMSTMGAGYLTQQIDLTYGVGNQTITRNKTDSVQSQKSNMPNKANNKDAGKAINDFEGSKSSNGESDVKASLTYDASKLQKTQPYTDKVEVADLKELIQKNGIETIDPILVRVENGTAYVVDGHHRLQAAMELGYERVPIHYIHSNELGRMGLHGYSRSIEEIIEGARLCQYIVPILLKMIFGFI